MCLPFYDSLKALDVLAKTSIVLVVLNCGPARLAGAVIVPSHAAHSEVQSPAQHQGSFYCKFLTSIQVP